MSALALKIPPPVVGLLLAIAMWFVPPGVGVFSLSLHTRMAAGLGIALVGVATTLSGMLAFRRVRTTVNPLKPDTSSSLVVNGVYRITRNPMYVGVLLVLTGWATFLGHALPFLALPVFMWYMTEFQIKPEERALTRVFGSSFTEYMGRVRRWV